ncbi:MAG: family 16 glycosylhydrolase [Bacteroidales bacterium]|nr:family 16 glycosylhydrolase [Bacteroidales bacterium]
MKKILHLIVLTLTTTSVYCQQCLKAGIFLPSMPACNNGSYYLAFEDNFDGNTLDLIKWHLPYQGVGRDFNHSNEKEWFANTGSTPSIPYTNNIEVSNGTLKLIAREETVTGTFVTDWSTNPPTSQTETFDYTSAEIYSNQEFFYGKYEIRCRLPNGKGFWPAFWTFGGQRWNEIDIFEIYGDDIDRFTCNVHHDYDGDGDSENCNYAQNNAADFTQWHVFTCLFDFDKITWQIDGNTVRVFHRFSTVSGIPISCGENIAIGTYFQEQSYPIESMNIIMNLSIQSGNNAPDANTVFPNTYEIDYVRFYIKSEEPPCEGCLDHIVYENTDQLPTITRASNYIQAGNNVTVKSGENVTLKAPEIRLLPGFSTEPGATFVATAEDCNLLNYADVPIDFIGSNAVDNYQVIKCIDPIYTIEATGVLFYSFRVYNLAEQLVHSTNGTPTANHINLWNAINAATAWYSVHLELLNCSDSDIRDYNLLVSQGSCKMANLSDTTDNQTTAIKQDIEKTEPPTLNKEFLIYPNPANEKLNVFYSANNNRPATIIIIDINGNELYREQRKNSIGANKKTIDTSQFPSGTYILRIVADDEKIENKFIITR